MRLCHILPEYFIVYEGISCGISATWCFYINAVNNNYTGVAVMVAWPASVSINLFLYDFNQLKMLGLGPHLFVKVPRTGDSEVTFSVFESSCHLLLPV